MNPQDYQFINNKTQYKPGMPYMIEVFATWCPTCLNMQTHLSRMTQQYPNVYILSVSDQSYNEVYQLAMQRFIMLNFNVAVDSNFKVARLLQQFGISSVPYCFVFNGHPGQCESVVSNLNFQYQQQLNQIRIQQQRKQQQEQDNFKKTRCDFSKL